MVGGGMHADEARGQADRDMRELLPDGLATSGHRILVLEDAGTRGRGGVLWFAEQERFGGTIAYLYDVEIDEPFRGRGLGREAMRVLEDLVLEFGAEAIDLAVFGGNTSALRLYESVGYHVTVRVMRKNLRPPGGS